MSDIVRLLPHYRGMPIIDVLLSNFMFIMLLNVYIHPEGVRKTNCIQHPAFLMMIHGQNQNMLGL